MALANGTQVFVKNFGSDIVAARMICGHFGGDSDRYIVLNPDGGLSDEDLGGANVQWMRVRPADGGIPFGLDGASVIQDMEAVPSPAEAAALFVEAAADIRAIVRRQQAQLGVAGPAIREPEGRPGEGVIVADNHGGRAPPGGPERAAPSSGLEPRGSGGQNVRVSGGLAALASAIGGGAVPVTPPAEVRQSGTSSDARVLTVEYDQTGERFRSFRDAVTLADEVKWPDWPVPGKIMTVLWCLRFMLNRAGTPTLWHQTFVSLGKLNTNDHQVVFHDALCRILETAMCYDQLNCPALASLELICRQIQCIEERYKDKFQGGDVASSGSLEHHLMAGIQSRSQLCICPALNDWLADEIRKQTAVDKERRKAREERTLSRPDRGKDGK